MRAGAVLMPVSILIQPWALHSVVGVLVFFVAFLTAFVRTFEVPAGKYR